MKLIVLSVIALAMFVPALTARAQTAPLTPATPTVTSTTQSTLPAINPEKDKLIRQLLHVIGYDKLALQMIDQMVPTFKKAMPNLPDTYWENFRKKIHTEDLIQITLPIYDKYYTKEDLSGLLSFYESPLGQKVIASLPAITHEGMLAGEAWGEKLGEEAYKEATAKSSNP